MTNSIWRIKLKTNKPLTKAPRKKKLKIKRIRTEVEISRTNRINLYFLGMREKKEEITVDRWQTTPLSPICAALGGKKDMVTYPTTW